jgi:hypothetical protein
VIVATSRVAGFAAWRWCDLAEPADSIVRVVVPRILIDSDWWRMDLPDPATATVIVVDVDGAIARDDVRAALLAKLQMLAEHGYGLILLNVAKVTYVDSVMLGAFVQAYTP